MTGVLLTNKMYDVLKALTTIVLPGASTLYFTLAQLWGLPAPEQVVGTIAAVNVFLGVLMGLATNGYNKVGKYDGEIVISEADGGGKTYTLQLNSAVDDLDKKKDVVFKTIQ